MDEKRFKRRKSCLILICTAADQYSTVIFLSAQPQVNIFP